LATENFGKAIQDCTEAIKCNPKFIKAYFRCAQAYVAVFKYAEAKTILEKGLEIE